jgi:hypothetical protein
MRGEREEEREEGEEGLVEGMRRGRKRMKRTGKRVHETQAQLHHPSISHSSPLDRGKDLVDSIFVVHDFSPPSLCKFTPLRSHPESHSIGQGG